MARQLTSTVRISKTRNGTRVRATGGAAQALFDAMCKAHGLDTPGKQEPADKPAEATTEPGAAS